MIVEGWPKGADEPFRKVWVARLPDDCDYPSAGMEVLIEQFGDNPPTVAFRPSARLVWGRPFQTEPG